jgi:hypothetical protein
VAVIMKTVILDVTPCSLLETYHFRCTDPTLKIEETGCPKVVNLHQAMWHHVLKDSTVHDSL